MSEIQQLINEIKGFMSGNNRSYTPRLKKMYEGYREQCAELAEMLAQCRALIQKGMLADARSLNIREKPSLTERFEILNFPGRQEFIDLCVDYGLQPMPEWDEKAVHELKAPVSASDANMASLMQQWRKIGRTGTAAQRIQVLRQIVASAPPNNAAWKRNLAEAEKTRYAEIGEELPQLAGRPDELDQLEKISLELFSPDQLIRPNDDLLNRFKEQLFPLQRKRLAAEMEKTLDEMQLGYESHDVRAIKAAYATWKRLISSPMAEIQPGQEQTVQDAMAYVERVEAEEADKSRYKQLMDELLQLLEKNAPYPEMERVYGALQRLERELPQSLVDQMRVREEDFRETERRQHVRRCLFGVTAAVIFLVLTFIGIQLLLYRNNVRQACNELARQKEEGLYEEGLALYENLKTTRPRIAQNSKVMVLQAEIRQALDERNAEIAASQQEFAQILQSVERFSSQKHYESKELDEMVARAEAIKEYLSDEQRQQYIRMKETIFEAKEKIRENRNDHFLEECDAFQKEVAELRSRIQENHDTAMELHRKAFDTLSSLKERILATDNIDSSLKASRKNLMESSLEVITATLAVEETYRRYVNVLESPRSLDEYLAALDFSPEIPEELRLAYARASSRMEQWRTDNEDFAHPSESLEKYVKSHPLPSDGSSRTLLYSEFKGAYLLTGPDPIRDSLTALLSSCDLYELVFFESADHPFYFYSKEEPELEWSKTNVGNLNFIVLNGRDTSTENMLFFKYSKGDGTFQFGTPTGNSAWTIPPKFTSLLGWNGQEMEFNKIPFTKMLDWIPKQEKNTVRFEQEKAIWNLLEFCLSAKDANPSLRAIAMKHVLQALCEYAPNFYTPLLNGMMEILSKMPLEWQNPTIAESFPELFAEMKKALAAFDWNAIRAEREFQIAFLDALWKHQLAPMGVVTIKEDKLKLATFAKTLPRELLVVENGRLHRLFTPSTGGTIAVQDKELLFNGQLIWGYPDGQTSEDFLKFWRERADTNNYSLKLNTLLCPSELAYFLK